MIVREMMATVSDDFNLVVVCCRYIEEVARDAANAVIYTMYKNSPCIEAERHHHHNLQRNHHHHDFVCRKFLYSRVQYVTIPASFPNQTSVGIFVIFNPATAPHPKHDESEPTG